jgi:hypothetical protein
MERWSLEHRAFAVATYFKNNDSVLTSASLVAILLPLKISQQQGVRKKPKTTVDLKKNIREEVAEISPNMLKQVMQNF